MSGTDYTLTPNLGLYKPVIDADVDEWGTHLNANADTLDAAFGPNGAFLPLAGGSVTGTVNIGTGQPNSWCIAGSSGSPLMSVAGSGNLFAALQGHGSFGGLLQSGNGNVLWTQDNGSYPIGNFLKVIADVGGNPVQLLANDPTGGIRATNSPFGVNYNFAWNNNVTPHYANQPFYVSAQVTGVSQNPGTAILMPIAFDDRVHTAQVLTTLSVADTMTTGSLGGRQTFASYLFANTVDPVPAWAPNTSYPTLGTIVQNVRNVYRLVTNGTSANTGGPTGSGSSINDGTCVWAFVSLLHSYNYLNSLGSVAKAYTNLGGTSLAGGDIGAGFVFGGGIVAALDGAGATYVGQCTGLEIDNWAAAGSSVGEKGALKLVVGTPAEGGSPNQGVYMDYGLMFNAGGAGYGVKTVMAVGSYSYSPPLVQNSYILQLQAPSGVAPKFSGGIDLRFADVSGAGGLVGNGFLWASPGAKIDGSGTFISGFGSFGWNSAGAVIDANYQHVTGATLVSGGSNFVAGAVLVGPVTGTRIMIDTVTAGAIATFHIIDNGWARTGALPANPVAFNTLPVGTGPNTLGSGAIFNLTYTAGTALAVMPSGGSMGFFGATPVAKPTVTGSKASNAALASLLTALASYGLVVDGST